MDPPYLYNSGTDTFPFFLVFSCVPHPEQLLSFQLSLPKTFHGKYAALPLGGAERTPVCVFPLEERREETRGGFIPMSSFAYILQRVKRLAVVQLYCLQCQLPVLSSSVSFPSSSSLWDWGSGLF